MLILMLILMLVVYRMNDGDANEATVTSGVVLYTCPVRDGGREDHTNKTNVPVYRKREGEGEE